VVGRWASVTKPETLHEPILKEIEKAEKAENAEDGRAGGPAQL